MKLWCTEIRALDPVTGEMKTWEGDIIESISLVNAQKWCNENRGYLKVVGELIAEIPCKKGSYDPDWSNMVDYENIKNN